MDVQITGLYCYPVKSCAGVALDACEFNRKGLFGDREWVVVDETGLAMTQRKYPSMACIHPKFVNDGLLLQHRKGNTLISEIEVATPGVDASEVEVRVWKDCAKGHLCTAQVNQWLTAAIGAETPLQLVRYKAASPRLPGYPERFGADATHFADAAPFLVANAFSLRALNIMLENKRLPLVDIKHFRPNIVVSGLPGFAEQYAKTMRKRDESLMLHMVDWCQRCAIITVDPHTGNRLPKNVPFRELAELNPMPDKPKSPAFGINARFDDDNTSGRLRVGDIWDMCFD